MRIVAEFPHETYKITLFKSGHRYILKFDAGDHDLSFKFRDGEVLGVEEIRTFLSKAFFSEVDRHFLSMQKTKSAYLVANNRNDDVWEEII